MPTAPQPPQPEPAGTVDPTVRPAPIPPPPAWPSHTPPPPGPAQRLAALAGAMVYEEGTSIFTDPVLVYLSRSWRAPTEFRIFDHVDRPRGLSRKVRPWALPATSVELSDPWGAPLLKVTPTRELFRFNHRVEGVASARFTMPTIRSSELTIVQNREPFGFIVGAGFQGVRGTRLTVLDDSRCEVGEIRTFPGSGPWRQRTVGHVVSLEPGLGGPLRRLLVAAPPIIEAIRMATQ